MLAFLSVVNISQGNVATCLRCGEIFNNDYYKVTAKSTFKEFYK